MTANAPGIEIILSNPFYLMVIHSLLLFASFVIYILNSKARQKPKRGEKQVLTKVEETAGKYKVSISNNTRPLPLFVSLIALVAYNIIAWFMRDQLARDYFDVFYEFYTGFVIFLLIWVVWTQLSSFLSAIFFKKYPTLDVRNHLKKRSGQLILRYMLFSTIVHNLSFPLIVFLVVFAVYPRPFFFGILFVLVVGVIQNLLAFLRLSGTSKGAKK